MRCYGPFLPFVSARIPSHWFCQTNSTVFHIGSNLVQVVLRSEPRLSQVVEKTVPDYDDAGFQQYFTEREASTLARELNTRISDAPPVRLSFYYASPSCPIRAVLSIHHVLYDGIALPVLLQDLELAYGHQPQLPSASLREALEHVALTEREGARAFWISYLKDYPWERLLNQSASSAVAKVISVPFKLPPSELRNKAAKQQVTLQALLMAAYGSQLGQHLYGHQDVVFGVSGLLLQYSRSKPDLWFPSGYPDRKNYLGGPYRDHRLPDDHRGTGPCTSQ